MQHMLPGAHATHAAHAARPFKASGSLCEAEDRQVKKATTPFNTVMVHHVATLFWYVCAARLHVFTLVMSVHAA
jgi:hypothetical protein